MINLLPDERKREIRAARMNVILLRYNIFIVVALIFLAATCGFFYLVLSNAQAGAVSANNDNTSKTQSYAEIRAAANEYRSNLSIAKQILGGSVDYSSFLFSLTKLLPSGVVLDGITLNTSSFTQQTSFVARATSFAKATELKERFQNSTLLANVYFQNIIDNSASETAPESDYPIVVTISAKVNKVVQP